MPHSNQTVARPPSERRNSVGRPPQMPLIDDGINAVLDAQIELDHEISDAKMAMLYRGRQYRVTEARLQRMVARGAIGIDIDDTKHALHYLLTQGRYLEDRLKKLRERRAGLRGIALTLEAVRRRSVAA